MLKYVDWELMAEQKTSLLEVIQNLGESSKLEAPRQAQHLTGLLYLIDYLQDNFGEEK